MKTPHKHAELIKAWADGAEVQVQFYGDWRDDDSPKWNTKDQYRIKPEPKPDFVTEVKIIGKGGSLVWNSERHTVVDANLKLTFDGETGKLKSAEVI